jgi:hypothetical protein
MAHLQGTAVAAVEITDCDPNTTSLAEAGWTQSKAIAAATTIQR